MLICSKAKNSSQEILFIGSGFVCSRAIKTLIKNGYDPLKITLITKNPYILFTPLLCKVAANKINAKNCFIPIEKYLGNKVKIQIEEAESIDLEQKQVKTKSGKSFSYDILVIGTGSKINTGNIDGLEENSLNLKTYENTLKIRELTKNIKSVVVIGAGITGVEISAELADKKISTYLITNTNEIIPYLPKNLRIYIQTTLQKKGVRILKNWQTTKVEPNKVWGGQGDFIETDLIINTLGVLPNYPQISPTVAIDEKGRILVNKHMQLEAFPNVFVGGDAASPNPMDAQAAWYHGGLIGKNILRFIYNKRLKKNRYKQIGKFVSLGDKSAIAKLGPIHIKGLAGYMLWQLFYIYKSSKAGN